MLRPAVDIVLETHEYKQKWLGDKLAALEKDIAAGTAPSWTQHYDHEFLVVLKNLANDALHTKAEGVLALTQKQDEDLYQNCQFAIAQLLDVVYERPERDKDRLAKLRSATSSSGKQ